MSHNRSKNQSGNIIIQRLQKGINNILVKGFGRSRHKDEIEQMVRQAKEFIQVRAGRFNIHTISL